MVFYVFKESIEGDTLTRSKFEIAAVARDEALLRYGYFWLSLRGHVFVFYGRGNLANFEEVRGPSSILHPESQIQDCFTSLAMTGCGRDCFGLICHSF